MWAPSSLSAAGRQLAVPLREAFGHGGDQVGVAQDVAQRHVVGHRESNASLQALALQGLADGLVYPAVACTCGYHPHMVGSGKVGEGHVRRMGEWVTFAHQAHIGLAKQRLL